MASISLALGGISNLPDLSDARSLGNNHEPEMQ